MFEDHSDHNLFYLNGNKATTLLLLCVEKYIMNMDRCISLTPPIIIIYVTIIIITIDNDNNTMPLF